MGSKQYFNNQCGVLFKKFSQWLNTAKHAIRKRHQKWRTTPATSERWNEYEQAREHYRMLYNQLNKHLKDCCQSVTAQSKRAELSNRLLHRAANQRAYVRVGSESIRPAYYFPPNIYEIIPTKKEIRAMPLNKLEGILETYHALERVIGFMWEFEEQIEKHELPTPFRQQWAFDEGRPMSLARAPFQPLFEEELARRKKRGEAK